MKKLETVKILLLCFFSFLFMGQNAYSFVTIKRTFLVDFAEIKGTENVKDFVDRFKDKLQTSFVMDANNDVTFYFLERFLQLYCNESKGIFNVPVILSNKYNKKNDLNNAKLKFHYYDGDELKIADTKTNIKIIKSEEPIQLTIELQNDFGLMVKPLIKVYAGLGDGSKFITDYAKTTFSLSKTQENSLSVDIEYRVYGGSVKQSVAENEISIIKAAITDVIVEFRQ